MFSFYSPKLTVTIQLQRASELSHKASCEHRYLFERTSFCIQGSSVFTTSVNSSSQLLSPSPPSQLQLSEMVSSLHYIAPTQPNLWHLSPLHLQKCHFNCNTGSTYLSRDTVVQMTTVLTDIRKTFTPWSSVSMAVIRMLFSLALSICIWAQSLVFRINLRLPWVLITKTNTRDGLGGKRQLGAQHSQESFFREQGCGGTLKPRTKDIKGISSWLLKWM